MAMKEHCMNLMLFRRVNGMLLLRLWKKFRGKWVTEGEVYRKYLDLRQPTQLYEDEVEGISQELLVGTLVRAGVCKGYRSTEDGSTTVYFPK